MLDNASSSSEIREATYEISTSKAGFEVLKINNFVTGSPYNPFDEAEKIVEKNFKPNHLHILLGFGMGYIPEKLKEKLNEHEELFIIEPNKGLFDAVLKKDSLLNFDRNDGKVKIFVGDKLEGFEYSLVCALKQYTNRVSVITSPNFEKIYPVFSKEVLSLIKERLMLEIVNVNTLNIFSESWQENFIKNMVPAFKATSLKKVTNKLNCPVVITSGGPSLTKQLDLLKKVKDKVLILCAGSTINSLLKNDITPHAVVTVDGGIANYNHFRKINIDSIPLIYSLSVHKDIPRIHKGRQYIFNIDDQFFVKKWSNIILGEELPGIMSGHSVANFCLSIAYQLTSGPICLIGQDLAYTNMQTHAEGNLHNVPLDDKTMRNRKIEEIKGFYHDKVLSDFPFIGMKKSFETFISAVSSAGGSKRIFNATEGGAYIEGIEHISFQEFVDQHCHKNVVENLEKVFSTKGIEKNKFDWERFLSIFTEKENQAEKILNVCNNAKRVLKKIEKNQSLHSIKDALEELDELDIELKTLLEDDFFYYILMTVSFRVNNNYLLTGNESAKEERERIILQSNDLYLGIYESVKSVKKWLNEVLDEIKREI